MNMRFAALRNACRVWPVPALLLAVAAVPAGGGPPAFPDVPRQAAACVIARFGDFYRSSAGQAVLKKLHEASPKAVPNVEKLLSFPLSQIEVVTVVVTTADERGLETAVIIVDLNKPMKPADLLKSLSQGEQNRDGLPDGFYRLKGTLKATIAVTNERRFTIFTNERARTEYVDLLLRRGPGTLDETLKLAAERPVLALGFRTADLASPRRSSNLNPQERAIAPIGETKVLTARAILDGTLKFDIRLDYADKGDAAQAEKALGAVRTFLSFPLGQELQQAKAKGDRLLQETMEALIAALKGAAVRRNEARVFVQAELAPVAPVAEVAKSAAGELTSGDLSVQTQLRQIGLALLNYEAAYGHLPPAAICDARGKPLLSWRVAILPFVAGDDVYQQLHLNEPWDSDNNKKLLAKMPSVFRVAGDGPTSNTHTPFRAFVGGGALFELRKGVAFTDITDGTSNTLMVGMAAESVPWTKPEELRYEPKKPVPALARTKDGGPWVLFADGSVRRLPANLKTTILRKLITRSGNEIITAEEAAELKRK